MPLVFAALTPHSPLLIPNIGKEQAEKIAKTKQALQKLAEDLYIAKPQILFVISPHSSLFKDSFSMNAHTEFQAAFEDFGDLATKKKWEGAPDVAARLMQACQDKELPLRLISAKKIDHGAYVPLFCLAEKLKNIKVLPIGYSQLNAMEHVRFGEVLKDFAAQSQKRIAIIASGDLSHSKTRKFFARKKLLDKKIRELLHNKSMANLIELDHSKLLQNSEQCGYRSIMIALGAVKDYDYNFKEYAYESPFGVGYLTGRFDF